MKSFLTLFFLLFLAFQQGLLAQGGRTLNPRLGARRFYDNRAGVLKNIVRIHLSPVVHTARISYERAVGYKTSVGVNLSHQFGSAEAGTRKAEIFGKWYLVNSAPQGLYLYGGLGYARFQNHTVIKRFTETVDGSELEFDPRLSYTRNEDISFSSLTTAFGIGFQNIFGKSQRWVADYTLGYQSLSIPGNLKAPRVEDNLIFGKFDSNRTILGPASPLLARFSLGYSF